jgi:O-antigen/teichoic acid export membrane protein/glycosyltransferase involved in cell wall biosynthesis
MQLALLVPAALAACALFLLSVARPAVACAVLAFAIPITAGLPRGAAIPLLRVNEALLLVVTAGFLVHHLVRRRVQPFSGLDVVVLAFCLTSVLVASAVILLTGAQAELTDWLVVVGPIQYLVVYVLYSRTEFGPGGLRLLLNLVMLASIPVAAVALAETVDLGGVRALVGAYYPGLPLAPGEVYRPESLLGHYSAVGAFGLLNLVLALALAAVRHPGFSPWWLTIVIGANLLSLVSSQTYAPLAALPVAAAVVLLVARRLPWRILAGGLPVLAGAGVVLWPSISGRIAAQFSGAGRGGLSIPETLATRIDYWQSFFVPALLRHGPWLGTGTLMPPEVPRRLVEFVDNGYLAQLFRAGLPGLAALLALLVAVAGAAWAAGRSPDPSRRVLGAVGLAAVVSVVLLNVTAEYLTFTAVSQEFWMLAGLLAGTAMAARAAAARPVLVLVPERRRLPRPQPQTSPRPRLRAPGRLVSAIRGIGPERVLVRSGIAVAAGFGLARALGLAFQVTVGRLLPVDGYGRLTYALAVANVAAVLLTTAPLGLSRFLSRSQGNRGEQEAYYVNWLAVVGILLGASAVVTVAVAAPLGLGGWLLAGLVANLLGAAALETYREVQRGLGRYTLQSVFYVLANVLQLAAVLVAATLGWRSPALFLVVYGLSSVAALALMAPFDHGLRLARAALRWSRMRGVAGFIRPVLLQAVFWNVWFNADLILVQHLRTAGETGTYAAAKTIANGFTLVPAALAFVMAPRVARLAEREIRPHLLRALALTGAVTVPAAIGVMAFAGPLTSGLFGGRYAAAALPLVVLVAGMVPYGLRTVLGAMWLGMGRPVVETASAGAGMVVTLALGLWLIPAGGAVAAALAFSAGAAAQLLVDGGVAVWALSAASPRMGHVSDRRILDAEPARLRRAGGPAPVLLVAEEMGDTPDEGYESFVLALHAWLAVRRPTIFRATAPRPWHRLAPGRALHRAVTIARAAGAREVRAARPGVVVYASRSSITLLALIRARLVRRACGGAPLAFVALQSRSRLPAARLVSLLRPDLLLVATERERDELRALGLAADMVSAGVDMERFRPPGPGERERLRRKWGVPAGDRVVLHVGHLRSERNLLTLGPLARRPGVTVVVAASSHRGPESGRLLAGLEADGVVVVQGYRPDVDELYRLADCYAFPTVAASDAVSLPLSVLEALASDLPVVTTRFGLLGERFAAAAGVTMVTPGALAEAALAACGSGARTRHLVERYSWDAALERLVARVDDLRRDAERPRPSRQERRAVVVARVRRVVVDWSGWPRQLVWGSRLGYVPRPASTAAIVAVEEAGPAAAPVAAREGPVGVVGRPALGAVADLLGLPVETARPERAAQLVHRALADGWSVLGGPAEVMAWLPEPAIASLTAFVRHGGTLALDALDERSNPALQELGLRLGFAAPAVRESPPARRLLFPGEHAAFARELAGTTLDTAVPGCALRPGAGTEAETEVLAVSLVGGVRQPALLRQRVGRGHVVFSVLGTPGRRRLADVVASEDAASVVAPLLLLRGLYGAACWHAPAQLANISIDDPALRGGTLGLPYDMLAAQARDHGFHVTVATVPRELALAEPSVVRHLREPSASISACYHGCDHDGYEFYVTAGSRTRHAPRPLEEQRRALWRAVEHGRRFARTHHHQLDRVMVFPYGVGPAAILPDLDRLGFVATCNYGDKYPLQAPLPEDADLGLRPADVAWEGFPLLWRRGMDDGGYLLDLVLGRPLLLFAHRQGLGRDFAPFVERAAAVRRASRGAVAWRRLDEVARHAYLQRHDPVAGWQALMTANEACLHNPDAAPRTYAVTRPHLPAARSFDVDGVAQERDQPLQVTVAPGATALVRVVSADIAPALAGRRGCSVFEPEDASETAVGGRRS